jgi:integrase
LIIKHLQHKSPPQFKILLARLQHLCNTWNMKTTQLSKTPKTETWPRKVRFGRETVTVYRRSTVSGNLGYMVANYADGNRKRRFDSFSTEAEAIEAANRLAKRLSERDVLAASMTRAQAIEYSDAVAALNPFNLSVRAASSVIAECLKAVGNVSSLHEAVQFYAARHKQITRKPFADVVSELLSIKEARRASPQYLQDLRTRLNRAAKAFRKDIGNVTTADIQEWLDGEKFSTQGYMDYRRVLHLLFNFAVARGYAVDNPAQRTERVKVKRGETKVFTPVEIGRLLDAARHQFPQFMPSLAIGAFAGVRSAEIERMEWSDIHLAEKFIVVGASRAKTAGRRVVPIADNLAEWLAPYAEREGKLWKGTHDAFYEAQMDLAAATAVQADAGKGIKAQKPVAWKSNALRHSYASYRFALTNDAGRVAGELGNSAAVVHKHYRELVNLADAQRWFAVKPEAPANIVAFTAKGASL